MEVIKVYTIKVNDDNSLVVSNKKTIMQRSSLVDSMHFLVAPKYNDYDMTEFTCMLEYILPVSRQYKTEVLSPSEELYQDELIEYLIPLDSELTSEAGDIEVQLTFGMIETDGDGNETKHIRKTATSKITITPVAKWSDLIVDEASKGIDDKLLEINKKLQELEKPSSIPVSGAEYIPSV